MPKISLPQARFGFAQLPTELKMDIFSYLDGADLKAVRSTCTDFRNLASPSLFRSIVACARYKAMQAFQNVSLHPIYQKYVKEIIFDGSAYSEVLAQREQYYQRMADEVAGSHSVVSWERWSRWRRYKELFEEQEDMKDGHVLLQTIARALDNMPNVRTITYSAGPRNLPIERKLMRDILPRGTSYANHCLDHLIGAVYISQYPGIKSFIVEPNSTHRLKDSEAGVQFDMRSFAFRNLGDLDMGKTFFQNLQTIHLDIALRQPHQQVMPTENSDHFNNMAALLREARDLRHLSFTISPWKPHVLHMYTSVMRPIFSRCGLDETWPQLSSVRLQGIHANEEDFTSLLYRHSDTLRSATFRHCSLLRGRWSSIVEHVLWSTKLEPFVLNLVNEAMVGKRRFEDLQPEEMELWQYEGQVRVSSEGERHFSEPVHKSVFRWRHLDTELSAYLLAVGPAPSAG